MVARPHQVVERAGVAVFTHLPDVVGRHAMVADVDGLVEREIAIAGVGQAADVVGGDAVVSGVDQAAPS